MDITLCTSKTCKKNCYRKNASINNYWQSYADFTDDCKFENFKYHIEGEGNDKCK